MTTRCASVIVAMMFIMISGSVSMAAEVCTKDRTTGSQLCVWLYKDACTLDNASWSGPVVDGKAEGRGVLAAGYHCEGDPVSTAQCDGTMKEGRLNGKGVCRSADGDAFEGDFLNGKIEGKGGYKWSDGRIYTGRLQE